MCCVARAGWSDDILGGVVSGVVRLFEWFGGGRRCIEDLVLVVVVAAACSLATAQPPERHGQRCCGVRQGEDVEAEVAHRSEDHPEREAGRRSSNAVVVKVDVASTVVVHDLVAELVVELALEVRGALRSWGPFLIVAVAVVVAPAAGWW